MTKDLGAALARWEDVCAAGDAIPAYVRNSARYELREALRAQGVSVDAMARTQRRTRNPERDFLVRLARHIVNGAPPDWAEAFERHPNV